MIPEKIHEDLYYICEDNTCPVYTYVSVTNMICYLNPNLINTEWILQLLVLSKKAHLSPGAPVTPAWISNHMSNEVWDEITYPFPNFNGCTVEVWEWKSNFIPHFIMDVITYPCWDYI